ncbi:MAG: hypothetical protein UV38_C0002G0052 [candidate division TM6 bacterium GW2011_GWE2_42_60]|nr:MAG: hypothetical protein UV38_C0002G0052 [candidate division TM6 bacterium GW2011_GWE2_42_60]HBY06192.1 hypothetical protein [Candidatus Dependentiae bacterium]
MKKNSYLLVLFAFLAGAVPQSITPMHLNGNLSAPKPLRPPTSILLKSSPSASSFFRPNFSNLSTLSSSWADRLLSGAHWIYENPYASNACILALQGVGSYLQARYGWEDLNTSDANKKTVADFTKTLGYTGLLRKDKQTTFNIYRAKFPATLNTQSRWNASFEPDVYEVQYNSFILPHERSDVNESARSVLQSIALSRLSQSWIKRDLIPLMGRSTIGLASQLGLSFLLNQLVKKTSTLDNAFINLGVTALSFGGGAKIANIAGNFVNSYLLGNYYGWVRRQAEATALDKIAESFDSGKKPLVSALNLKAYKEWLNEIRINQICYTKRAIVQELIATGVIGGTGAAYSPAEIQVLCLSQNLRKEIQNSKTEECKTVLLAKIGKLTGQEDTALQEQIYTATKKLYADTKRWNAIVVKEIDLLLDKAVERYTQYFPAPHSLRERIEAVEAMLAREKIKTALAAAELKINTLSKELKQTSIMKKFKTWVQSRKPSIEKK